LYHDYISYPTILGKTGYSAHVDISLITNYTELFLTRKYTKKIVSIILVQFNCDN